MLFFSWCVLSCPEETLRTLGTALEKAGNARIELAKY